MSTGNALAMRLKLKHLGVQHRVASQGEKLPLFDPTSHDMVLEGYCATDDLDHDRTKLRKYAFGYPLLFRHGYPQALHPPPPMASAKGLYRYSLFDKVPLVDRNNH